MQAQFEAEGKGAKVPTKKSRKKRVVRKHARLSAAYGAARKAINEIAYGDSPKRKPGRPRNDSRPQTMRPTSGIGLDAVLDAVDVLRRLTPAERKRVLTFL